MQLPQVRLQQTYAKIGLEISEPQQKIRQPKADLNLSQEPAKVTIDRTPAKLEIDQTQAWNDRNLKDPFTLTRDEADRAHQLALQGIARVAQEGGRLAAIERGGKPIVDIAYENTTPGPIDFNYGVIPRLGAIKMRYHPTELKINVERGGAHFSPEIHRPEHQYTPGQVQAYLKQKQSLSIDFVGLNINQSV